MVMFSPPFAVVPMPLNSEGSGPEMDEDEVKSIEWQVWDSAFLLVSVHSNEKDSLHTRDLLNTYGDEK